MSATLRTLGIALLATVVSSATVRAEPFRTLEQCRALVCEQPRSLDGYECLLTHRFADSREVLGFLEARLRSAPGDPRPRLYRAVVHHFAGDTYDFRDYVRGGGLRA